MNTSSPTSPQSTTTGTTPKDHRHRCRQRSPVASDHGAAVEERAFTVTRQHQVHSSNDQRLSAKASLDQGAQRYQLKRLAEATLGSAYLKAAVELPMGEDEDEWLAILTMDFFNQVNIIYGTISKYCTAKSCPTMSAGPRFEYQWSDGVKYKKLTRLPAPAYVEMIMGWAQSLFDNASLFPVDPQKPFPPDFRTHVIALITKRLFRVYAHIYYSHFRSIASIGQEANLNTSFKHFILFVREFGLLNKELEPLRELIKRLLDDQES